MAENTTSNQNTTQPVTGSRLVYIILLVGFSISLLLQVIGLVTPGWLVADFSTSSKYFRFSMGLWYVNFCFEGTCDSKDFDTFWEDYYKGPKRILSHDMNEYRAETILAIMAIVVGIGGLCKLLCCSPNGLFNNHKHVWSVLCAASALSGILALVASVRYGQIILEAHDEFDSSSPSPYKEPFSLIITGVGGVIAGLMFIATVLETCRVMAQMNRPTVEEMTRPRPIEPLPSSFFWNRLSYEYNYALQKYEWKYR